MAYTVESSKFACKYPYTAPVVAVEHFYNTMLEVAKAADIGCHPVEEYKIRCTYNELVGDVHMYIIEIEDKHGHIWYGSAKSKTVADCSALLPDGVEPGYQQADK